MSRISVIIPLHNRAHVVGEAIESVLAQTYQDFELIVVDDASTDNAHEVLARYVAEHGLRIRVVRHETNRGAAAARNEGIRASTGEYVAFLDSDDLYLPARLELATRFLDEHAAFDVAYSRWHELTEQGTRLRRPSDRDCPSGRVFDILILRQLWHTNTITVRRGCFDDIGTFDESLARWEDRDLWLRLAWSCEIGWLPEELAVFRPRRCPEPRGGVRVVDSQWQVEVAQRWLSSGRPFTHEQRRRLRRALFFAHWEYANQLARAGQWTECREALRQGSLCAWEDRRVLHSLVAWARSKQPAIIDSVLSASRPIRRLAEGVKGLVADRISSGRWS